MSLSHYQGLWPRSSDKCPPYFSQKYHKAYLLQEMSEDVRLRDTDRVFSRAIDGGCILKEYFNIWGKYASRCAGENFTENVWLAETTSCNVPIKGMHFILFRDFSHSHFYHRTKKEMVFTSFITILVHSSSVWVFHDCTSVFSLLCFTVSTPPHTRDGWSEDDSNQIEDGSFSLL